MKSTELIAQLGLQEDNALFQKIRQLRLDLAQEQGYPAYIVLNDKVLHTLATIKPTTIEQFGAIDGVGEYKTKKYGQIFIDAIKKYLKES